MSIMLRLANPAEEWGLSKCGPQAIDNSIITWTLVRNVESQAPVQIYWIIRSEQGASIQCLNKPSNNADQY